MQAQDYSMPGVIGISLIDARIWMRSAAPTSPQAGMGKPETKVADLCTELGITRQTLCQFVDPDGSLRNDGERLLERRSSNQAK